MDNRYLLFLLSLAFAFHVNGQLVVNEVLTPTQLVEDILLGGGVTVSNVTYNGIPAPGVPQAGSGSFTANATNLGLNSGIVLATGLASNVIGPAGAFASDELLTGGDLDLEMIAGTFTFDRSVLEFDFVPSGNEVNFRYVFASEEYPDFVCSPFNDAFGFFLSGPGIAGPFGGNAANIALIPGTAVPVTINAVNNGIPYMPGEEFNCEDADPNWLANTVYFVDNQFGLHLAHGGFTTVFEAIAEVQCGETYHIKIAIADAEDWQYDSAVFLEANSFSSTGQVFAELQNGIGVNGNTMTQGCGPFEIVFTRGGDLTVPLTVDLAGTGTAVAGVDYIPAFPAQISFAAGEASQSVFFDVPNNANGPLTLTLTITSPQACAGSNDVVFDFIIETPPPIDVVLDGFVIGCGEDATLTPVVSGGTGTYEYLWDTNETTASITVTPAGTTDYTVTVTDECGAAPVSVTATITVLEIPMTVTAGPDIVIPCGETDDITVDSVDGGNGVYTYTWTLGGVEVGNTETITVPAGTPSYYVVTVEDGCGATAQDSVLVSAEDPVPVVVEVEPDAFLPCVGQGQVSVVQTTGGNGQFTYEWTFEGTVVGTGTTANVDQLGWYVVTVTEGCGGTAQDSVQVIPETYDPLEITVSADVQVPCQQQTQIAVLSAIGGYGPYTYVWTANGIVQSNNAAVNVPGAAPQYYVATVTDACGTSVQDSVLVSATITSNLQINTAGDMAALCPGDVVTLQILGVQGATGVVTTTWTDAAGQVVGFGSSLDVPVNSGQTYTITVMDVCGNTGTTTISTILTYTPDLQVILPEDMLICAGEEVELIAQVYGGSGFYYVDWHHSEHDDPVVLVAPLEDTRYTVTISDQCGDVTSGEIFIEVEHISLEILSTNFGQDEWLLRSTSTPQAITWVWDMGDSTRYRDEEVIHRYVDLEDHWVTLMITTINGCSALDSLLIRPPAHLYFPNAFSPDGDGFNELFGPVGHDIEDFELLIFDRWGSPVFASNDMTVMWDGTIKGAKAPTGIYVYRYRATGLLFLPTEGFGHVALIRGDLD